MRHRTNQKYTFQQQPNLTKSQWTTWKEFIRGNFLAGLGLDQPIHPLSIEKQNTP